MNTNADKNVSALKSLGSGKASNEPTTPNNSDAPYIEYCNSSGLKRNELPLCPVETTAQLIGSKWRLLILRDLMQGPHRFGELRKSIGGISQKVLTSNLREMENSGLVLRRVYPEVPPHVEYELTDMGKSLKPVIEAMWNWGTSYQSNATEN